jgi:uncharacterized repeat protein (TIGR03803 family)
LYGTTDYGGTGSWGTVFKITPGGTLTRLYSFCSPDTHPDCPDGDVPALLIQSTDGDFYGITTWGGSKSDGTSFEMTPDGTRTTIHNFCSRSECADGGAPIGLIQAANGAFYGTTNADGANGYGTFYKINPNGVLTTLYDFCSQTNCTDGGYPATLIQATNGNYYGTTSVGGTGAGEPSSGGVSVGGIVFEITPSGEMTTLYNFCSQANCTDGQFPVGLIQATDGNFYGVALEGGTNNYGTVFKLSPSGALTTLYNFCSESTTKTKCTDGATPTELIQGSDTNLYGITRAGGAIDGSGTVFKMTRSGKLAKLYTFCMRPLHRGCPDGESPNVLIQDTDGNFYGTTYEGGAVGAGTVFSLSTGLGPFVAPQTYAGTVGSVVNILGNNLTGASSVTFNGLEASFTVVSDSEIAATVPTGATTGIIKVIDPGGTLESDKKFMVRP